MPNVLNVPGVPQLLNYAIGNFSLLINDAVAFLNALLGSQVQWGIFLNGEPVIIADSVISFEYKQDSPVSTYPVEDGGFQSYDKVQLPADIRMRFSTGGSISNRQDFLNSIDEVMSTVDLYDIVTPEQVYLGYNFTHRDFHRTSENGVGLIVVDLWLTEIRVTSTAMYTATQQPGEAGQQSLGSVQPQSPSSRITQGFNEGTWTVQ